MTDITDEQFNDLIAACIDELPEQYTSRLSNLLITFEDEPTAEQRVQLKLRGNETLFGLFEGIPNTSQAAAGSMFNPNNAVLPGKITIFKNPALRYASDMDGLKTQVKHTLWHEVAHYFGLDHDRIHEIERNWQ